MNPGDDYDTPRLRKFREAVRREFGQGLEKATPVNVREFLDRLQETRHAESSRGPIVLDEPKTTYEEILKDFFVQVLEHPSDRALITLWTLAFDLSFFNIEQHAATRLQALFGEAVDE